VAFALAELRGDVNGIWWKAIRRTSRRTSLVSPSSRYSRRDTSAVRRKVALAIGGFDGSMPLASDYGTSGFRAGATWILVRVLSRSDGGVPKVPGPNQQKDTHSRSAVKLSLCVRVYEEFSLTESREAGGMVEERMREMLSENLSNAYCTAGPSAPAMAVGFGWSFLSQDDCGWSGYCGWSWYRSTFVWPRSAR